jgi:hypothetical protein
LEEQFKNDPSGHGRYKDILLSIGLIKLSMHDEIYMIPNECCVSITCSFALTLLFATFDIKSFNDSQIVHVAKLKPHFLTSTFK